MNLIKTVLCVAFSVMAFALSGQTVMTITEDTVFDETMVFTENTIIEGVDFPSVAFNGSPKFIVKDCIVLLKGMRIEDKKNWGTIEGDARLEWHSIGMEGFIQKGVMVYDTFLDGRPN